MRWVVILVVLTLESIRPVWAVGSDVVKFAPAEARDIRLLNKLLPDRMREQNDIPVPYPQPPTIAWVKISGSERKYLFVLLPWECGVNCTIYGFRRTSKGWAKVYDVEGGDDIEVLKSQTSGHHDLQGTEVDSASSGFELTSHWDGNRYGEPNRTPCCTPAP